ncbi:MAG TPA: transglutaminase family protein [Acidimicrobiales bacterium]|nr:transglutaminase family protein [Acidimicrobiales bacterium]
MTWRIDVRHTTGYRYEREVLASYNEARLTPLSTSRQLVIGARLEVAPATRLFRYWDHWGSIVHAFDVHVPHDELIVTATSLVETPSARTHPLPEVGWSAIDDLDLQDKYFELLTPSRYVDHDPALVAEAAALRANAPTPADAVDLATTWVQSALTYEKGSTSVSTSALDAWRAGRGVCQDFVHLTLALMRAMGIPARYVSGYFHPRREAEVGEKVVGESHAWAEAWLGEWHPFDPTNGVTPAERHVMVGRGRDYADVSPLRGLYSGAPSSTPMVTVELIRRR